MSFFKSKFTKAFLLIKEWILLIVSSVPPPTLNLEAPKILPLETKTFPKPLESEDWSKVPTDDHVYLYPFSGLDPKLVESCESLSKQLVFTFKLDFTKFLIALSGVETSFNKNNKPRFEKAYAPGGFYFKGSPKLQDEWKKYGDNASSSWGPWQILHIVACEYGYKGDPQSLYDPKVSGHYVVQHLNKFSRNGANSLERILDCYNTGNQFDKNVPYEYIGEWWKMYLNLVDDRVA